MDEKTKQRQEEIIELVTSFCKDNLNEEYADLACKLVEKMGRKHNVPFKRGRLDIWASAVIYALAQVNFLFDKSSQYYISANDICDYFGTKKSTVSSKAALISDMFRLTPFDNEFSTKENLSSVPRVTLDDNGFIVPASEMDIFFDEVYELFEKGNIEEAIEKLDTIGEDSPEYLRALFYKSVILSAPKDDEDRYSFIQSLEDIVLSNENDDYREYFQEGLEEYNSGNYEDALMSFNISIGLNPNQSEALFYKAITLGRLFEFEEALDVIDKAIELDSEDSRFWNDKANFLTRMGKIDDAVKCFDKASQLKPDDSVIFANKGFMYFQIEDYENAIVNYNKACEIERNVHNLVGLSNVYIDMNDWVTAEKYLDEASNVDDEDEEYLTAKAHFLMFEEHLEESLEYWDKILKLNPNQADAWLFKSIIYSMLGNIVEAEKCFQKAIEIDPMSIYEFEEMLNEE